MDCVQNSRESRAVEEVRDSQAQFTAKMDPGVSKIVYDTRGSVGKTVQLQTTE